MTIIGISDKNRLLSLSNELWGKQTNPLAKVSHIKDFSIVEITISKSNFYIIEISIKWGFKKYPKIDLTLKFETFFKVKESGQLTFHKIKGKGRSFFLNVFFYNKIGELLKCNGVDTEKIIKLLDLKSANIWPRLENTRLILKNIEDRQDKIKMELELAGKLILELKPKEIPLIQNKNINLFYINNKDVAPSSFVLKLKIFNSTIQSISKEQFLIEASEKGFKFDQILLKLENGQICFIGKIERPFKGFLKTNCGLTINKESGKILVKDVETFLETNNILAHFVHLTMRNTLHQLVVSWLQKGINHKIKEKINKQIGRLGSYNSSAINYVDLSMYEEQLMLSLTLDGRVEVSFNHFTNVNI